MPRTKHSGIASFIAPISLPKISVEYRNTRVCAVIPTYAPGEITLKLVQDLLRFNPRLDIYVVDDCTPESMKESVEILAHISVISPQVTVLRTPINKMKASALNYALRKIGEGNELPDVIVTLDDDVVIHPSTVKNLVVELMSYEDLGAVCSACRVLNKNKNVITRLQGLEYVGFNAIRLADQGFFMGPLVMHGMLTAFRGAALYDIGGFKEGHLIEDYEATARLKERGWHVASVQNAPAWTVVPETFSQLWHQRTRWIYGGITVVARAKRLSAVVQDLIGHTLFIATILMVAFLYFSQSDGYVHPLIADLIIALSFLQLAIWYPFQLWLMRLYKEKDVYDWILRISFIPEFLYSYVMTAALLGSYAFYSFTTLKQRIGLRGGIAGLFMRAGTRVFLTLGYAETRWGTKTL